MGHRDASSQEAFFNCLYEERFSKMKRYALILLSNPELAEEVVQDAFLELYLHIDEVMAHEKPEFWLQKAVKYKSLHKLRERARDLKQYVSLDSDAIPPISAPDEFEKIEEDPDSLEKLNRKISEALPAKATPGRATAHPSVSPVNPQSGCEGRERSGPPQIHGEKGGLSPQARASDASCPAPRRLRNARSLFGRCGRGG